MITEKEFEAYERVRASVVTNMYDVKTVERYSGLSREKIFEIMKTYNELMEQYPEVRK